VRLDLSFSAPKTAAPSASAPSQGTAQPTSAGPASAASTAEPGMPVTGYSGWLLAGGAALGALLLLSAGARRALHAHERVKSRD